MTTSVRVSSPLRALAERARELSSHCDELWVATAFVTNAAVHDVVEGALEAGAGVRFLTGTFGHVTRLRTFRHLHRLAQSSSLSCRVWRGDFHVKMLIWRAGNRATAWIGSANLTDRGLQCEGELMLEVTERWSAGTVRALRRAYDVEWDRARDLDQRFLRAYRESPHVGPLLGQATSALPRTGMPRPGRRRKRTNETTETLLVVPILRHYADGSAADVRITARLGGTARYWFRGTEKQLRAARPGHLCLLVDAVDNVATVAVITGTASDGRGKVLAYEPYVASRAEVRLTAKLRRNLTALGLSPTTKAFRARWLGPEQAAQVIEAVVGSRAARRFEREAVPTS